MAGNQGFASMSEDERKAIARKGGQASGGKFEAGSKRASEMGRKGAEAQPLAAKRRGGENSHRNAA